MWLLCPSCSRKLCKIIQDPRKKRTAVHLGSMLIYSVGIVCPSCGEPTFFRSSPIATVGSYAHPKRNQPAREIRRLA